MLAAGIMIVGVAGVFILMWKMRRDRADERRLDQRLKSL